MSEWSGTRTKHASALDIKQNDDLGATTPFKDHSNLSLPAIEYKPSKAAEDFHSSLDTKRTRTIVHQDTGNDIEDNMCLYQNNRQATLANTESRRDHHILVKKNSLGSKVNKTIDVSTPIKSDLITRPHMRDNK